MIEIIEPGPLCTVQDEGRPGWAHVGVGRSGAADRAAFALATRLVGNRQAAAALECTFGGLQVRFLGAALLAGTGAESPLTDEGAPPLGLREPMAVPAGAVVRLGLPATGV